MSGERASLRPSFRTLGALPRVQESVGDRRVRYGVCSKNTIWIHLEASAKHRQEIMSPRLSRENRRPTLDPVPFGALPGLCRDAGCGSETPVRGRASAALLLLRAASQWHLQGGLGRGHSTGGHFLSARLFLPRGTIWLPGRWPMLHTCFRDAITNFV